MRNAFAGIGAAVDHDAVTALFDSEFLCEFTGHEQKFSENLLVGFGGRGETRDDFLRNDQDVDRRLRIYVFKGDGVVVFPNNLGRDFARDDFLKDRHGVLT